MRPINDIERRWYWVWLALLAHATLLVATAGQFDHELYLHEVPAIPLALGLVVAGAIALYLPSCIAASHNIDKQTQLRLLTGIIAGGIILRLLMFWTVPALETDLYRYLWDGAVVAIGHNPYAYAPGGLEASGVPQSLRDLALEAGYIHERINQQDLRTIYPPVAQVFFAVAYLAETWSITAWRLVCLLCELTTLWLLLRLLDELGRSRLWLAIYWWNPLIIKELMNSAHMEAVLVPFLLAAVLLAVTKRNIFSCLMLALAAGIKIWPVLLLPLVLRPLLAEPHRLTMAVCLTSLCLLALALPPLLAGLDQKSGFVAYAAEWRRNGALNPLMEMLLHFALSPTGFADGALPNQIARGLVAIAAATIALLVALPRIRHEGDLVQRMTWVVLAVFLLSPAQYPWYLAWILPLMVLRDPLHGVQAATVILPIYYASFYFRGHNIEWAFNDMIVFAMWIPIWLVFYRDFRQPIGQAWRNLSRLSSRSHT
ncbi:MAG: glycosyltransferase 87 family protein [Pseudomonadota bacterium]